MSAPRSRTGSLQRAALALLHSELARLGRPGLDVAVCFSDASWRREMLALGCPAYNARLASPTTRRSTRGKLGMATVCHLRHGHRGVIYVRIRGRSWEAIQETVRHEALHLARPSYSHRQVETALRRTLAADTPRRAFEDLPERAARRR